MVLLRLDEAVGAPPVGRPSGDPWNLADERARRARLLALRMHVARYLFRTGASRPRVAVLELGAPPRALGGWVPDMVDAAGGIPALAAPGAEHQAVAATAVAAAEPQVLLLGRSGVAPADLSREARLLVGTPPWERLPAVAAGQVWLISLDPYFVRPGPALVEGVEVLIRILHPAALATAAPAPAPDRALRLAGVLDRAARLDA